LFLETSVSKVAISNRSFADIGGPVCPLPS
jgi:hypothetical protein